MGFLSPTGFFSGGGVPTFKPAPSGTWHPSQSLATAPLPNAGVSACPGLERGCCTQSLLLRPPPPPGFGSGSCEQLPFPRPDRDDRSCQGVWLHQCWGHGHVNVRGVGMGTPNVKSNLVSLLKLVPSPLRHGSPNLPCPRMYPFHALQPSLPACFGQCDLTPSRRCGTWIQILRARACPCTGSKGEANRL